jgi:hypothetical protein
MKKNILFLIIMLCVNNQYTKAVYYNGFYNENFNEDIFHIKYPLRNIGFWSKFQGNGTNSHGKISKNQDNIQIDFKENLWTALNFDIHENFFKEPVILSGMLSYSATIPGSISIYEVGYNQQLAIAKQGNGQNASFPLAPSTQKKDITFNFKNDPQKKYRIIIQNAKTNQVGTIKLFHIDMIEHQIEYFDENVFEDLFKDRILKYLNFHAQSSNQYSSHWERLNGTDFNITPKSINNYFPGMCLSYSNNNKTWKGVAFNIKSNQKNNNSIFNLKGSLFAYGASSVLEVEVFNTITKKWDMAIQENNSKAIFKLPTQPTLNNFNFQCDNSKSYRLVIRQEKLETVGKFTLQELMLYK